MYLRKRYDFALTPVLCLQLHRCHIRATYEIGRRNVEYLGSARHKITKELRAYEVVEVV